MGSQRAFSCTTDLASEIVPYLNVFCPLLKLRPLPDKLILLCNTALPIMAAFTTMQFIRTLTSTTFLSASTPRIRFIFLAAILTNLCFKWIPKSTMSFARTLSAAMHSYRQCRNKRLIANYAIPQTPPLPLISTLFTAILPRRMRRFILGTTLFANLYQFISPTGIPRRARKLLYSGPLIFTIPEPSAPPI